ncbi:MAG: carboxypeptidase regulatory-like domain-containing protein [Balneolaceae bacterium]
MRATKREMMNTSKKITVVILLFIPLVSNAQTEEVSLTKSFFETPLVDVLEYIEQETRYTFSYSSSAISTDEKVTVNLSKASITEAIAIILEGLNISFEILNSNIILKQISVLQTVRGNVVDKHSHIPITGASVIIADSNPLKGDATDIEGNFRIENVKAGRYTFKVSFLGYEDILFPGVLVGSGKEVVLNFELSESLLQLDEIQVGTASISSAPLNDMAQVSGRSFTVEETKRFPVSVGDPLRLASSFAGVITTDDSENEIVIRGNSPRGILWKLEGVEIPSPNHFSSEGASTGGISMFSTQVISRSDFLTSAFPAQYGNATAGVFDIQLRNGNNERRESTLQFGLLGVDISSEGPISSKNKSSYLFNYRYSTLSLLTGLGLELEGEGERNIFQDLSFKINVPTKKIGTFSIFGLGGLSSYTYKFFNESDKEEYNMGVLGLSNKYIINNSTVLSSTISISGTEIDENFEGPIGDQRYEQIETFQKTFLRGSIELDKKFNAKNFLSTGVTLSNLNYDFKASERDPRNDSLFQFIEWFNDQGNTTSFQGFTSWKFRPTEKLTFVNGIHLTHFGLTNEIALEPRSNVRFEIRSSSAIFGGFGLHSRIESLEYYFGNAPNQDGSTSDLNGDLKLTRSGHFVLGFDANLTERVYFKTEIYYQRLYNVPIIAPGRDASPFSTVDAFSTINLSEGYVYNDLVNGGTGKNYGIEFTVERKFDQSYYFLFNGTLYESTYKGRDGISRSTRFNGNYGYNFLIGKEFKVGSIRKDKVLGLNLKINHAGNKRYTPINASLSAQNNREVRLIEDVFAERFPTYFRADLQFSLRKNVKRRTSEWRLDIQNITNRENIVFNYYSFSTQQIVQEGQFGLIPILSYRIEI